MNAPNIPEIKPNTVFFGLNLSINFLLPNNLPNMYAKESQTQTLTSIVSVKLVPLNESYSRNAIIEENKMPM